VLGAAVADVAGVDDIGPAGACAPTEITAHKIAINVETPIPIPIGRIARIPIPSSRDATGKFPQRLFNWIS